MTTLPFKFPDEQERLRRLIDANRDRSFPERVQLIDDMLSVINTFETPDVDRDRLRDLRETEFRECIREFVRRSGSRDCGHPATGYEDADSTD